MTNHFLLQDQFASWLALRKEKLCMEPHFYTAQIAKLSEIPLFVSAERNLLEILEIEVLCNNPEGVEEALLKTLNKMKQIKFKTDSSINPKRLDALRLGLLKYRLFLHDFMMVRNINYHDRNSSFNDLSEVKCINLDAFFKENINYLIPIYHDNYVHCKSKIDEVWQELLATNTWEGKEAGNKQSRKNGVLESILVKTQAEKQLEVLDGGDTLIMFSILLHVLIQFSNAEKDLKIYGIQLKSISQKFSIETRLNEQRIFTTLLHSEIDKEAKTPKQICKEISYEYSEPGIYNGYHFLQTTFRFVQLIQECKIPQSENHIPNIDVFISKVLKNTYIKRKQLMPENRDKLI
ncbi:hypothetical protein ACFQ3R_02770 [Mesonia ostreae]|uniref:Uncharacterized protein n=1 Tax=Mesonia ostreae TaxID=861110 RepID=A0ABU2KL59_9FLAO|nr:hypothetical protein [Mesonia ostreae]MDT0295403.1 hypothetical protein [Mesonia ostreae]